MISSTGNNSNAISYNSLQHSINSLSAEKMFRKLSGHSGGDITGVTKNTTDKNTIGSHHSDSNSDDALNNGIIRDDSADETSNVSYIHAKTKEAKDAKKDDSMPHIRYGSHTNEEEFFYDGKASPPISSFDSLAAEIGAIGDKISKEQLVSYLNTLTSDGKSVSNNSTQIAFVKNLLAKFYTIASGQEYITSLTGLNDAQDYRTVTKEQVTPPFDLRV